MATPAPTRIADYDIVESITISHVRRWLRARRELAGFLIDVLCELVAERATGTLTVHLTQGCAASAEFTSKRSASTDDYASRFNDPATI